MILANIIPFSTIAYLSQNGENRSPFSSWLSSRSKRSAAILRRASSSTTFWRLLSKTRRTTSQPGVTPLSKGSRAVSSSRWIHCQISASRARPVRWRLFVLISPSPNAWKRCTIRNRPRKILLLISTPTCTPSRSHWRLSSPA